MHVILPLTMLCIFEKDETLQVDAEQFVDVVVSNIYREIFSKHVKVDDDDYNLVYKNLLGSTLSQKTKNDLAPRDTLICTMNNIQWVVDYWQKVNSLPDISTEGAHGFMLVHGKLQYVS